MKPKSLRIPGIRWKVIGVAILLMMTLFTHVKPVLAHAKLVKSEPSSRATLTVAPTHIQLWFNEEIEGAYASISVLDAKNKSITDARPETVPDDLTSVVLPLPAELTPGRYIVEFRVMATDGHVAESTYNFTVKNLAQEK